MSITMPTINSGDPLDASTVNSFFNKANRYLNGEMESSDFDSTTAWVEPLQVVQPEFYGAPSPRTELVSGTVHHRKQFNKNYSFICSDDFAKGPLPIPSLSATVYSEEGAYVIFHCNFYCFEAHHKWEEVNAPTVESVIHPVGLSDLDMDSDEVLAAEYQLYMNGSPIVGTKRNLYWNYGLVSSKTHTISAMFAIPRGMVDICVKVKPIKGSGDIIQSGTPGLTPPSGGDPVAIDFYQIVTQTRNMVIDIMYR